MKEFSNSISLKVLLLNIQFLLFFQPVFSQCFDKNAVLPVGEKLYYQASYNWGFVWLDAGEAFFTIDTTRLASKKTYIIKSFGKSYPSYDWIYKIRDNFECYIDYYTLRPLKYSQKSFEGSYFADINYTFDNNKSKVALYTGNSNRKYKRDTLKLASCTADLLTAVYFVRMYDYSKLKNGDKIFVSVLVDNEIFELYATYLGVEIITLPDGRKFRCHRVKPKLVKGTIFDEDGETNVWLTDDKNKLPILVEAEIIVGSVKAIYTRSENLKYKMEAEIKK